MSVLLQKALRPATIRLHLEATDKDAAIRELLALIDDDEHLRDRAAAEEALFAREISMSTGMGDGIAMPHAKTNTVDHLTMALGLKAGGLDFDSADGEPAKIFFLTLSPANKAGPHIQLLSEVSNIMRHAEAREAILKATSPEGVFALLTDGQWG